jgi:hypothetical protein
MYQYSLCITYLDLLGSPLKKGKAVDASKTAGLPTRTVSEKSTLSSTTNCDGAMIRTLRDEREKRVKAETAVLNQKALMAELQKQVLELQDAEAKTLTLRQGLVIARLGIPEKVVMKTEMPGSGQDTLGLKDSSLNSQDKRPSKSAKVTPMFETYTAAPVKKGTTHLAIEKQEDLKKGLYCVIGFGSKGEITKIAGISGLVVSPAISAAHETGTLVRIFPNNAKGLASIHVILSEEVIHEILYEDVIPMVCKIGDAHMLDARMDALYRKRPMKKAIYNIEVEDPIQIQASNLLTSTSEGVIAGVSAGSIRLLDPCLSSVDLVCFFHECCDDILTGQEASLKAMKVAVNSSYIWSGIFDKLSKYHHVDTVENLLSSFGVGYISWEKYVSHIVLNQALLIKPFTKAGEIDESAQLFLSRLYTILDSGRDESISLFTMQRAFAELDGVAACDVYFRNQIINARFYFDPSRILFVSGYIAWGTTTSR